MKIRTDFVTNSSSSAFVLSLKFLLKNGEEISWEGASDCGEGSYQYVDLSARKSPKELGNCENIEELVEMVKTSIGENSRTFSPIFNDDSSIVKALKDLSSMEEIETITIEGYEDAYLDAEPWLDDETGEPIELEGLDIIVTYDMHTRKETVTAYGDDEFSCEGSGGSLDFPYTYDLQEAPEGYFTQKRECPALNWNEDEEEYLEDCDDDW